MADEDFPDSPTAGVSPRISFSHDLSHSDVLPVEQYIGTSSSSSSIDFDFCVYSESFDHDSSSADELFFDGKILPIEIKKRLATQRKVEEPPPAPRLPPPPPKKPSRVNEMKNPDSVSEEKHKSFWRFKRSSSLNCGGDYGRTLCPLRILSRSNSTGSTASGKRAPISNNQKQNILRSNSSNSWQKQQGQYGYSSRRTLKNCQFSYSNGIKFNPILNVPPANLFALGSIFSGGKVRSKK